MWHLWWQNRHFLSEQNYWHPAFRQRPNNHYFFIFCCFSRLSVNLNSSCCSSHKFRHQYRWVRTFQKQPCELKPWACVFRIMSGCLPPPRIGIFVICSRFEFWFQTFLPPHPITHPSYPFNHPTHPITYPLHPFNDPSHLITHPSHRFNYPHTLLPLPYTSLTTPTPHYSPFRPL